jgi:alpha-mannosidase II
LIQLLAFGSTHSCYLLFGSYYIKTVSILKNVITSLVQDKRRTFVWESVLFLERFMQEDGLEVFSAYFSGCKMCRKTYAETLKALIQAGQLELVGGGYISHDEALSQPRAAMDQMALGLSYLRQEFGEAFRPTVGWQIGATLRIHNLNPCSSF